MRTLALVLGTALLMVSLGERAVSDEPQPWSFDEHYQITMTRVSARHSPRHIRTDQGLQTLQADLAPIWNRPLTPDEMVDAMLTELADQCVEVKRSKGLYEWRKYADCHWAYICREDILLTVDPEGDPIEINVRAYMPL